MSGLSPGAVAPDGTVASLKSGVATVLLGVSRGTGLPTKALVSVELLAREAGTGLPTKELVRSAVLATEAGSVMVAVGLQMLAPVLVPNGVGIGSGGTRGGELTEGLKGLTEDDGDDADAALAAATPLGPMIVVGHTVIVPSDSPGSGGNTPR
jgi:hypothetical protein